GVGEERAAKAELAFAAPDGGFDQARFEQIVMNRAEPSGAERLQRDVGAPHAGANVAEGRVSLRQGTLHLPRGRLVAANPASIRVIRGANAAPDRATDARDAGRILVGDSRNYPKI